MGKIMLLFKQDWGVYKAGDKAKPSDAGIGMEQAKAMEKKGILTIQEIMN